MFKFSGSRLPRRDSDIADVIWSSVICTKMIESNYELLLEVFRICLRDVGAKVKNVRLFLKALYYFTLHNISWRALPEQFGNWNSVWKRFDGLGKADIFEDYFSILAGLDKSAHRSAMFDSTGIRAHISADGAKRVIRSIPRGSHGGFGTNINLKKDQKVSPWVRTDRKRSLR